MNGVTLHGVVSPEGGGTVLAARRTMVSESLAVSGSVGEIEGRWLLCLL